MHPHRWRHTLPAAAFLGAIGLTAAPSNQAAPLVMDTARVTVSGTSNIHPYSAWTDTVRLTRVALAQPLAAGATWEQVLSPAMLETFEIAVPVATLTARDRGLTRNLHKALKLEANRDITFRLSSLESGVAGQPIATGRLRIAGVERDVVLPLAVERRDASLVVRGRVPLLMTDYGITPPTAMLGLLHTDAAVLVTFEVVLSPSST